ncbi:hypothetical protein Tco_1366899 [Tanacetum coccineum]
MSSRHSTWPVVLCIYNLPSWLCMKRKYLMMSLLLQGPKQPDNDIDVYLAPLIDDMKTLWYGCIKDHKKIVKNGQARTQESEEYKKKPKNQSQSQKVKDRSQIQSTWSTAVNHYKTKPHNNPIPVLQLSQKAKNDPSPLIGPKKPY